ncbi:AAA family ATPase [Streptomyces virginiae]|uniref:AAA family ATPase n=1 Tax=Streptomyces virginiae TaxID=1961 RepID=UPI000AF54803|nr:AAA family ATPase [Streptomyces virginiae]
MTTWMRGGIQVSVDFVDRVEEMAELNLLVTDLVEGRGGRTVVLDSVSGMGKTALLQAFTRGSVDASSRWEHRVVTTRCHPGIGPGIAYGPVVDLLLKLGEDVKQPGVLRRMLSFTGQGVARSAPEVLSAMVPGLGAIFSLGREVTEASLTSGSMPFDSLLPFQQAAAARIVEALLELVRQGSPTVLLIDDIQHSDPSTLLVLDQLVRRIPDEPLAVVLTHTIDGAYAEGPGETVEEQLHRWSVEGLVRRRTLGGLPEHAVAELVRLRCPQAPAALSQQLSQVTLGHTIFVSLCLDEWTPSQGARISLPASLSRIVERRLRMLSPQDRELLAVGATQGSTFLSSTIASVKGSPHDEIMERLRLIARNHRLIVADEPPAWARMASSDCYRFEHRALWGVIQAQQSPEQIRSRHVRIAAALTTEGTQPMPLERRLEIAHHLRSGGPACLADSADAHYTLARDAATEGLSFAEAEQHCKVAIAAARELPQGEETRDRKLIRAIELLLALTEVRWRGQNRETDGTDIDALAAEAESAAARCRAPELLIRTRLLRGKTLMATRGLVPSLDKLREAVELAERHDDPVALFVARVEYGRQVSKLNLAEGLAQLSEAEALSAADARLPDTDPVLQHARNLGEMQLGISLFDSGRLGVALSRLQRCVGRLRSEPLKAELPIALNYLAQVLASIGAYQEAEDALREALAFEEDRGGDSGWHAYNTALLSYILAQQGGDRRRESLALVVSAWAETERTWLANLVPIVRNLYAEILLHGADEHPDGLGQAYALAGTTVDETRHSGMVRSQIAAHSLQSRALLRWGDTARAASAAREALRLLDGVGDMPALRTEEVLYHSAVVLATNGARQEARELLERARAVVGEKAGHLHDDTARRRFLTSVPLNRAIRAGHGIAG